MKPDAAAQFGEYACSFCGRTANSMKGGRLLVGPPGANICSDCLAVGQAALGASPPMAKPQPKDRPMTEDQRMKCLEMAIARVRVAKGEHCPSAAFITDFAEAELIVKTARAFADFLSGTNDADVLRAARDLAEKVNQSP